MILDIDDVFHKRLVAALGPDVSVTSWRDGDPRRNNTRFRFDLGLFASMYFDSPEELCVHVETYKDEILAKASHLKMESDERQRVALETLAAREKADAESRELARTEHNRAALERIRDAVAQARYICSKQIGSTVDQQAVVRLAICILDSTEGVIGDPK